jgi:hypothetical protein
MTPISGFTIVRNASLLNYPFEEAVLSALPLCDEFIINCGESDDDTEKFCDSLIARYPGKIRLIKSRWATEKQSGGLQLREQTNAAQAACQNPWCFYIQADEVLHDADIPFVRAAVNRADRDSDIDGVVFDYVHFYVSYDYEIRGRNWYRREVRLFKTGRGIQSFRDAQGFRKEGKRLKAIRSGARIFHYGYVRSPESLRRKSIEMSRWWGENPTLREEDLMPCNHVGLRRFTGSHPLVMNDRISKYDFNFDPKNTRRKWNRDEIKNALTLLWESVFPWRIGEFRNYDLK